MRVTAWARHRTVSIGVILVSWAAVAAVAWSYWPQETVCRFDHAAIARDLAALQVVDLPRPEPDDPALRPRLADCVLRGTITDDSLRRAFPTMWHEAFVQWSRYVRAHGLPIVALALDAPDGDAFVVFADRCDRRMVIGEQLADIWVRGRGHYPAIAFGPVDPGFDPSPLRLDPSLAAFWADGAEAEP
jgi:hypothetical protein